MAKKKISFGKVDGYHRGRKDCKVEVMLDLRACGEGREEFAASAHMLNRTGTQIIRGGQCLDALASEFPELAANPLYAEILRLWGLYHLNGMHPGTPAQEKALRGAGIESWASNFEKCCEYLGGIGLLEDPAQNGYRFGSGWLYWPIPEGDLERIRSIISGRG